MRRDGGGTWTGIGIEDYGEGERGIGLDPAEEGDVSVLTGAAEGVVGDSLGTGWCSRERCSGRDGVGIGNLRRSRATTGLRLLQGRTV